jgi:hypothetical protein
MLSPLGGEGSSSGGRTSGNPNRHSRMLSSGMLLVGGKGKEREKVKITRERERLDTNASSSSSTAGGGAATGGHVFRLPFSSSASQPSRMSTSASLSFSSAQSSSSSNPSNPYRPSPTSAMRPKSPLHTASSLSPSTPPFPRAESSSSRRTSQIVLQSGLLLKHEPPSTGFGRSSKSERENLGRHWKPYRVELKGSKLYFFKAPADRKAAIEAGFPTTMLPALVRLDLSRCFACRQIVETDSLIRPVYLVYRTLLPRSKEEELTTPSGPSLQRATAEPLEPTGVSAVIPNSTCSLRPPKMTTWTSTPTHPPTPVPNLSFPTRSAQRRPKLSCTSSSSLPNPRPSQLLTDRKSPRSSTPSSSPPSSFRARSRSWPTLRKRSTEQRRRCPIRPCRKISSF